LARSQSLLRDAGTAAFAQTVIPYVREHNTVLLSNHGIICWADSVTTPSGTRRCSTPIAGPDAGVAVGRSHLADLREQTSDLLAIKRSSACRTPLRRFDVEGVPVVRFEERTPLRCFPARETVHQHHCDAPEMERLVKTVTDAVMSAMGAS